jgi:DNA-binding beta-propeller fold protein YncE
VRYPAVGSGAYRFRRVEVWPILPDSWSFECTSGVAVDPNGIVWVLCRNAHHPVSAWRADGTFVTAWGAGLFSDQPHGIAAAADGTIWIVDRDWHVATRFSPDGHALQTLGRKLAPSPTCDGRVVRARPFNMSANLAIAPDGEIYAADGYGNHKVHRFAADGRLIGSWGRQGLGPGEFALVHDIALDGRGRVFVCDDENDRVQIFDRDGVFLEEWPFANPSGICIRDDVVYVSELQPFRDAQRGPGRCRISLWTLDRHLLAQWCGADSDTCDLMLGGHALAVDARGSIYVAEVASGQVAKFVRVPDPE